LTANQFCHGWQGLKFTVVLVIFVSGLLVGLSHTLEFRGVRQELRQEPGIFSARFAVGLTAKQFSIGARFDIDCHFCRFMAC